MRTQAWIIALGCAATVAGAGNAAALDRTGFALSVLVDGQARPEYYGRGKVYVEAVRGHDYALSLTNPLPYRVAVALSVDGLNTIDAQRTNARDARKWVLGPYETIEISGWQVDVNEARRFFFTGERQSYGAYLGETANLGVIEAVFYRERVHRHVHHQHYPEDIELGDGREAERRAAPREKAARQPAAPDLGAGAAQESQAAPSARLSDEYAATGIGARDEHQVTTVNLELESAPAATLQLRYEYRTALVRLGILPRRAPRSPLDRREHAGGFAPGYCPDPDRAQ